MYDLEFKIIIWIWSIGFGYGFVGGWCGLFGGSLLSGEEVNKTVYKTSAIFGTIATLISLLVCYIIFYY